MQIIVTESMSDELKKMAKERGASVSSLARIAIAKWLEGESGHEVEYHLDWGGARNGS